MEEVFPMIELYYWRTPNGHKITMFLEEAALQYRLHPVDISAGDPFTPEFLRIAQNNRMPAYTRSVTQHLATIPQHLSLLAGLVACLRAELSLERTVLLTVIGGRRCSPALDAFPKLLRTLDFAREFATA